MVSHTSEGQVSSSAATRCWPQAAAYWLELFDPKMGGEIYWCRFYWDKTRFVNECSTINNSVQISFPLESRIPQTCKGTVSKRYVQLIDTSWLPWIRKSQFTFVSFHSKFPLLRNFELYATGIFLIVSYPFGLCLSHFDDRMLKQY